MALVFSQGAAAQQASRNGFACRRQFCIVTPALCTLHTANRQEKNMAFDPYGPCPCGSGKKFKWCCQPVYVQIDKAFQQDEQGQHDTALRMMDEVCAEHSGNPEVWGRKAQLLYQMDRVEDAENALQKAFDINPNYPFG